MYNKNYTCRRLLDKTKKNKEEYKEKKKNK